MNRCFFEFGFLIVPFEYRFFFLDYFLTDIIYIVSLGSTSRGSDTTEVDWRLRPHQRLTSRIAAEPVGGGFRTQLAETNTVKIRQSRI